MLLGSLPVSLTLAKNVDGVQIGVCTYSFRDMPRKNGDDVGPVLQEMKDCNADICELFSPQLEPEDTYRAQAMREAAGLSRQERFAKFRAVRNSPEEAKYREDLRQWRIHTPMEHFRKIRQRFDAAGIEIYAYTLNFNKEFTDAEMDGCFRQAKALRAKVIASSTTIGMLPRLLPLAEKYRIHVAVHGHSNTRDPDQFSSPATFQKALDMSPWFRVNLDIGHFFAAGFDPVDYIQEHHARITHIHVKDRKRNDGPNEPFGQGETPITGVLRLLKEKRYPIPALVEYEYRGAETPVQEVNKCLAYMTRALQSV